jgi:hypothetical protein
MGHLCKVGFIKKKRKLVQCRRQEATSLKSEGPSVLAILLSISFHFKQVWFLSCVSLSVSRSSSSLSATRILSRYMNSQDQEESFICIELNSIPIQKSPPKKLSCLVTRGSSLNHTKTIC